MCLQVSDKDGFHRTIKQHRQSDGRSPLGNLARTGEEPLAGWVERHA